MLDYPVRLEPDGDSILVTSPDFPELVTFGEDRRREVAGLRRDEGPRMVAQS